MITKIKWFILVNIARLFGRAIDYDTGFSNTMPRWVQNNTRKWHKITHFHVNMCSSCKKPLQSVPIKPGWAGSAGMIGNKWFCTWCYDYYKSNIK